MSASPSMPRTPSNGSPVIPPQPSSPDRAIKEAVENAFDPAIRRASFSDNVADDEAEPPTTPKKDAGLAAFARCAPQRNTTADSVWMQPARDNAPIVVGIAGGTGSGKTTVAAAIAQRLGSKHMIHLQHDSYYRPLPQTMPLEERAKTNFDHPDALETSLLCEHLCALRAGNAVSVPKYDFATHQRLEGQEELMKPARIILVEGILIYAHEELRSMLDIKIFVDTESDVRFIRRLQRDVAERGRDVTSVIEQYLETVRPMHNQFVEPSKRNADLIIPTGYNSVALEMVIARLELLLEWGDKPPPLNKRQSTPRMTVPPPGMPVRRASPAASPPTLPKEPTAAAAAAAQPSPSSPPLGQSILDMLLAPLSAASATRS